MHKSSWTAVGAFSNCYKSPCALITLVAWVWYTLHSPYGVTIYCRGASEEKLSGSSLDWKLWGLGHDVTAYLLQCEGHRVGVPRVGKSSQVITFHQWGEESKNKNTLVIILNIFHFHIAQVVQGRRGTCLRWILVKVEPPDMEKEPGGKRNQDRCVILHVALP